MIKTLGEDEAKSRGIVIGYDHRKQNTLSSKGFALITAAVAIHRGVKVYFYTDLVATPLVPWAVDSRNAAAGFMVTASHNPAKDNGYKVYWGNGAQIIPPHDKGMASSILENLEPWTTYDLNKIHENELVVDILKDESKKYMNALKRLVRHKDDNGTSDLKIVLRF